MSRSIHPFCSPSINVPSRIPLSSVELPLVYTDVDEKRTGLTSQALGSMSSFSSLCHSGRGKDGSGCNSMLENPRAFRGKLEVLAPPMSLYLKLPRHHIEEGMLGLGKRSNSLRISPCLTCSQPALTCVQCKASQRRWLKFKFGVGSQQCPCHHPCLILEIFGQISQ